MKIGEISEPPLTEPRSTATSTRPKIALLSRHFSPVAGGAEAYAYRVVECLKHRYAFTVYAQSFGPPIAGVVFHSISAPPWMPRWINQWHFSRATQRASKRSDLVHSHESVAYGQVHTVHVQTVRSNLFGTQAKRHPWVNALRVITSPRLLFYLWIERKRLRHSASHIVFASDALKMDTLAAWPQLDPRKLSVIRPGTYVVDLPRSPHDLQARKAEAQAQVKVQYPQLQDLPSHSTWLLFAANDWSKKGLKTALQALAELPAHCHLLIAGKTEQFPAFARQLQQPPIMGRTHILGPVDGLPALYQACDLLLHPTHQDAYPMVVLEAFGYGLPVITTTTPFNGLAAELNDHQQALLIQDPDQVQALVHAIGQSLNDREQTAHRVHAAHAFAQAHAWENVAQCYAACYEDALQTQREASQHASR